jgi:hypothetical protein
MLLSDWGLQQLSLGPFGYKICQGLVLDCRLGHIGYVEPQFGDPSCGETVPDNLSEPKHGSHTDRVALKVV